MNNTLQINEFTNFSNRKLDLTLNLFSRGFFLVFILTLFVLSNEARAQVVTHPKSEVTTTAKHYQYTYNISATQHKVIEYILVLSANGDIKSTFNACDVCYPYHKGYSQSSTKLRCNNCGNSYFIEALGSQGAGGCWPGHLEHSLEGDNIVINVSDLIKGEYYFVMQVTGVNDNIDIDFSIQNYNNSELKVNLKDSYSKNIRIVSVDGRFCKNILPTTNEFFIDISDLASGVYYILTEFNGTPVSRSFSIFR